MRRDPSVYLYDIVSASELIFQFVQEKPFRGMRIAVERILDMLATV